jgi:hypothetical protein
LQKVVTEVTVAKPKQRTMDPSNLHTPDSLEVAKQSSEPTPRFVRDDPGSSPQAFDPASAASNGEFASNQTRLARIAQRAYELHVAKGGSHGSDLEDWLQAERELDAGDEAGQ